MKKHELITIYRNELFEQKDKEKEKGEILYKTEESLLVVAVRPLEKKVVK